MKKYNGLALIVMDGFGLSKNTNRNAVINANPEFLNSLFKNYPFTELSCHGLDVGLPEGTMGNSEVGHSNIGAGRIVMQDLVKINFGIKDGSIKENKSLNLFLERVKKGNSRIHLMGLFSESGVHSDINHLFYFIDYFRANKVKEIFIHSFLDGRDSPPKSAPVFVKKLMDKIKNTEKGVYLSTLCGRFYAMDRDTRWERTKIAYDLLTKSKGRVEGDPFKALDRYYKEGVTDEFMLPVVIKNNDGLDGAVGKDDGVLFYNFRADRAKQITMALTFKDFDRFPERLVTVKNFLSMTKYDDAFQNDYIIGPENFDNILGQVISDAGFRQFRTAETEKYAHVTYFFNCGREAPFKNEERKLIPSPRECKTYDEIPEMSAYKVKDALIEKISTGLHKLLVCNFANCDMVGHTGNYEAAIKAVKAVDKCVSEIVPEILKIGYACIITADHGNAETMVDENGHPMTNHTLNPVPFVIVAEGLDKGASLKPGRLSDIAPTILRLLGMDIPHDMTGRVLWE